MGALRQHGTGARYPGEVLRERTISRLGVDVRVARGPSITVAATASARVEASDGVLAIDPGYSHSWRSSSEASAFGNARRGRERPSAVR